MMAQTLQLAFRIAFVWAGGFLLAVAVRALLPEQSGLTFAGKILADRHKPLLMAAASHCDQGHGSEKYFHDIKLYRKATLKCQCLSYMQGNFRSKRPPNRLLRV